MYVNLYATLLWLANGTQRASASSQTVPIGTGHCLEEYKKMLLKFCINKLKCVAGESRGVPSKLTAIFRHIFVDWPPGANVENNIIADTYNR